MGNYNIINILTFQLNELEHLIKKDSKRGNMIYNYFINEDNCKLLDYYKLQSYLTETKIENLASLKQINNLCLKINNLWNNDLRKLNPKKLKEPFVITREDSASSWISSSIDFYAIYISEFKFHYCTFENEKKQLILNKHKRYTLENISSKCRNLRNILTSFYPTLRVGEDPRQYLIQYKNFKKIEFTPRPYNMPEYELMKGIFNSHVNDCKFVFLSLDKKERQGFKNHIIKNLNKVENVQVLPKFKTLLFKIIALCNNNFDKPQLEENTPNKFNPSQFNEYTHNLFTYILNEYEKKGKIKYINIWYFLKKDIKDKTDILFNFTQEKYKIFVKREYGIEIKKFQKAEYKYLDNELGILQNIFKTYCDNLNRIDTP